MTLVGRHRPDLFSVRYAVKMYGVVSGLGHGGNAMVWVLDDQTIVVIQNSSDQSEGGVKRSIYSVTEVRVSSLGLTAQTDTGEISLVQAPCVCGAGPTAIAYPAMPDPGKKLDLQPLTEMPDWVRPAAR